MKRTELKRTPPKTRAKVPPSVAREVAQRCHYRCIVCGDRFRLHRHHVLSVNKWPEHELQPLNMVLACWMCHANHEVASRRIRQDELPEATLTWIRTLGGRETLYLERVYPTGA